MIPAQPIAAVAALVPMEDSVLLIKRRFPPNQDLWVLPGGKIKHNESLYNAVEREVKEETGIRIKALSPIHVFDLIHTDGDPPYYHYIIIAYYAQYVSGDLHPDDDALDAVWASQLDCATMELETQTQNLLTRYFQGVLPRH